MSRIYPQIEISGSDVINFLRRKLEYKGKKYDYHKPQDGMENVTSKKDEMAEELIKSLKKEGIGQYTLLYLFPASDGIATIDGDKYKTVGIPKRYSKESILGLAIFHILKKRLIRQGNLEPIRERNYGSKLFDEETKQRVGFVEKNQLFGLYFNTPSTALYPVATNLFMTNGVKKIEDRAFEKCEIKYALLPRTLTEIPDKAFKGCLLHKVKIPGNIEVIGQEAFERCEYLKKLELENGTTIIRERAFCDCDLREVDMPSSVKYICDLAFSNNYKLSDVTIKNGTLMIGYHAFDKCNVKSIKLPHSVKQVNGHVLRNTNDFKSEGGITYTFKNIEPRTSFPQEEMQERCK